MATGTSRYRRRAGHGDGARHPLGGFVANTTEFFDERALLPDLPFLVHVEQHEHGLVAGKFLTADELAGADENDSDAVEDRGTRRADRAAAVPNGSLGFRRSAAGEGRWNLDLEGITPALTLFGRDDAQLVEIALPAFDAPDGSGFGATPRCADNRHQRPPGHHGLRPHARAIRVHRDGMPGEWPSGYDDASTPYTPAWQAEITSVPAEAAIRVAREFATNAVDSGGRSMIIMGAGICQWFHGDATYRAILSPLILTGCMGRNGGGWAHYVGQEKCRPITGWMSLANGLGLSRTARTS